MSTLRIYKDALRLVRLCRPHWEALAKHGCRDLAGQLKRAAPAVPLNIAEGRGRYNGNGRQRFETAYGSANESIACLEVGVAMGALSEEAVAEAIDCADKIAATLTRILRPKR